MFFKRQILQNQLNLVNKRQRIAFMNQSSPKLQIPMFHQISLGQVSKLYSSSAQSRYNSLLNNFFNLYACSPDFIARAPGRVNIIGSHIDYSGYGVLPFAIEKDCLIAVCKSETDTIELSHVDESSYPRFMLSKYPAIKTDGNCYDYVKYFSAGYFAGTIGVEEKNLIGMKILIEGNVPIASGVSSSSALCVCSALVAFYANKAPHLQKTQFIQRVVKAERQVGTAGGGMDQSISVLGQLDACLYIKFNPLTTQKIVFPKCFKFVVMNSLVESKKLNTAAFRFNKRVCECRLAARIIGKRLGFCSQILGDIKILKELQQRCKVSLNSMSMMVEQWIGKKPYTVGQMENILGCSIDVLVSDIPCWKMVVEQNKLFNLYEAAMHAYSEAFRVVKFTQICKSGISDECKLILLGKLMNQSHFSSRDLYKSSCVELEELTTLARNFGAYGSKLTGAGWGGCTVTLLHQNQVQSFITHIINTYYSQQKLKNTIQQIGINNIIFVTKPSHGASIILI